MCTAKPPAVFNRRGQRLHLKCLAFWCCISTSRQVSRIPDNACDCDTPFSSSNSLSQYQHQGRRIWERLRLKSLIMYGTYLLILLLSHCCRRTQSIGGARKGGKCWSGGRVSDVGLVNVQASAGKFAWRLNEVGAQRRFLCLSLCWSGFELRFKCSWRREFYHAITFCQQQATLGPHCAGPR